MIVGTGIYQLLSGDADVSAEVGTRIYPALAAQQPTMPFITYEVIQVSPSDTKDGGSTVDEVRTEVITYAATYGAAAALSEKVRTALDRQNATNEISSIQSIQFTDAQNELLDSPRRFLVVQDYKIRQIRTA